MVLVVTSLAAFMAFLDATIVNIAFPSIQHSFPEVSRPTLSWVLNGYNVVFAALLVPAGRIADLLGRRRVFYAGLLLFTTASALCAVAPSAEALIAFRVLQAIGAGVVVPTSLALLLAEFPFERRVAAIALLGASAAVAAASGPSLGGLLINASNWRLVFLVNLPLALLTWLLGRRVLQEGRDRGSAKPDLVGTVVLALGVAAVALALVESHDWGWGDPRVLGSLALGAAMLVLSPLRARRHPSPVIELSLLRIPSLRVANTAILLFAAAFYAKILCDVLFLTSVWKYSILTAGLAITPGPLITAIAAGPAGRLAERLGPARVAGPGAIIYAAGCAWYAVRAGTDPAYIADWLPGTALTGIGIAMAFPTLTSAAVIALPPRRYGTGSALNATARQLGGVLGVALLVAIVGNPSPAGALQAFDNGWTYAAIAALLAAGVALVLRTPQADVSAEAGIATP
jgi:EmrB/QacA subfamily drug resistance transporter